MTNYLPVSSSMITPMSPIVSTPVSLGACTLCRLVCLHLCFIVFLNLRLCLHLCLLVHYSVSAGVSTPVFHSVPKPETMFTPVSLGALLCVCWCVYPCVS